MAKTKLPKGYMYTPDGMMKISDYEKRTKPAVTPNKKAPAFTMAMAKKPAMPKMPMMGNKTTTKKLIKK